MREPDFEGVSGRNAFRVVQPTERHHLVLKNPAWTAQLAGFLVNAPGAHPFWSQWMIALVHLRPIPNTPPPKLHKPDRGYEIMCHAIDPEKGIVTIDMLDEQANRVPMLEPIDWVVQLSNKLRDDQAIAITQHVIESIMSGRASPDSDFRYFWIQSIAATERHYLTGAHEKH